MRLRKATAAVVVDEPPPEDIGDPIPSDDGPIDVAPSSSSSMEEGPAAGERVCVECGGDGDAPDACAHRELAIFRELTRTSRSAIARLRRAAAEHRAAERALRALVASEFARGRAEFVPLAAEEPVVPASADAGAGTCARCAERDAAEGAASGEGAVGRGKGGRGARRRARGAEMQQASFAFAADAALAGDLSAGEPTQPAVPPSAVGRA